MAAPVRAPILFSGADEMPDGQRRSARGARPRRAAARPAAPGVRDRRRRLPRRRLRDRRVAAPAAAASAAAIAEAARPALRRAARATSSSPRSRAPAFAMPAAAWAARSGDPVLFAGREQAADGRPPRRCEATRRCRSTCSAPPRRSPPTCVREIAKIAKRVQPRLRRGPGRQRDRPRPLRRRRLRLERQRPRPRLRPRPQRLAARRRRRGAALGLRHLGAAAAHRQTPIRCRRRCAATCSTSSPATRPTRPAPSTTTSG